MRDEQTLDQGSEVVRLAVERIREPAAYREGKAAWLAGKDASANPYRWNTAAGVDWHDGWRDGISADEARALLAALRAYDQPVRTAINMLERRGGAAAEIAEELRACLAATPSCASKETPE